MLLRLRSIDASYQETQVLWNVSLEVKKSELTTIIGSNGAGKTTIMKVITGLLKSTRGTVFYQNERIDHLPSYKIVEKGIALSPEGRCLFPKLTVLENLEIGNYLRKIRPYRQELIQKMFELFPILKERRNQLAETLSGGESQMLAIARAMMSKPKLLLLDEPSLGLAPNLVSNLFKTIKELNEMGITIMIVEQHVSQVLKIAHRVYLLENGRIVMEDTGANMLLNKHIKTAYLGL
jgi:branched-chain amino acid transport system ATP-binding protein